MLCKDMPGPPERETLFCCSLLWLIDGVQNQGPFYVHRMPNRVYETVFYLNQNTLDTPRRAESAPGPPQPPHNIHRNSLLSCRLWAPLGTMTRIWLQPLPLCPNHWGVRVYSSAIPIRCHIEGYTFVFVDDTLAADCVQRTMTRAWMFSCRSLSCMVDAFEHAEALLHLVFYFWCIPSICWGHDYLWDQ